MTMQGCVSRSHDMPHAAAQCEAGSFARFFLDHAMMDTMILVSIFAVLLVLGVSALLSTRIILLAVLLAALVILGAVPSPTQPTPPRGGV